MQIRMKRTKPMQTNQTCKWTADKLLYWMIMMNSSSQTWIPFHWSVANVSGIQNWNTYDLGKVEDSRGWGWGDVWAWCCASEVQRVDGECAFEVVFGSVWATIWGYRYCRAHSFLVNQTMSQLVRSNTFDMQTSLINRFPNLDASILNCLQ